MSPAANVLRKLQKNRAWTLLLSHAKRFATSVGIVVGDDDLSRHLRQRPHSGNNVNDLEARCPRRNTPFLAGDDQHRHGAQQGVSRARREVERARARVVGHQTGCPVGRP